MNFVQSILASNGGLSLVRILGSLSKTIGIYRQVSPILSDMKPLMSKVPEIFNRISSIRNTATSLKGNLPLNSNFVNTPSNTFSNNMEMPVNKGPVFFQ